MKGMKVQFELLEIEDRGYKSLETQVQEELETLGFTVANTNHIKSVRKFFKVLEKEIGVWGFFSMFREVGCPDLACYKDGNLSFVECKRGNHSLTLEQVRWLGKFSTQYPCYVVVGVTT